VLARDDWPLSAWPESCCLSEAMRLHLPLLLVGLALGLGSGCGSVLSKSGAGGTGGSGTGGSVGQGGGGGQAGGGCTACRSGAAAACPAGVSAGAPCPGTFQTCCAGEVEFQCGCNTMSCAWSPICGDTGGTGGAGGGGATTGTGGAAAGNGGHAGRSGGGGAGGSGGQGGTVGGSGGTGACVCPTLSDPVCGVDGKTYGNPCEASCAGVAVAYQGSCPDGGADGGPPLRYCDTASDCVFRAAGCCGGSCAAKTDPVSPPGIICNDLCAEPACACVNHQCSTAARDGGAADSGGGTGNADGSAGSGGPDGDAGCAGENENCTNGPAGRACCGGLLCCYPLPSDPPISLGSYCGYACPA
jgi:hypothetical protein